ncbi:MAG: universal stress protein [Gammaproteobacteria bacterium]|nr:universal stress protein [Rhodocyclaceae bacterium]MBU3910614.1 universal stress protein [Gammaproteobacteria bacterium]MBU3988307.1 universal stress protein [Gammaproteobacteria bacterium]MBU4005095.1 universal stress protein [Gammaproteobacteria bacterium]MBU4020688.1 universal stress protein [Gammaproteobacteria bacterium]
MSTETCRNKLRHLLVAVDESENSQRTVAYLIELFGGLADACITLLTIIPEPLEDFFPTVAEGEAWLKEREALMRTTLADYQQRLRDSGFQEAQVDTRIIVRACNSIANAILEEREKLGCRIVVVGRRGVSRNEEFIFGSTSSKILHEAKGCAVLVVE